MKRLPLAALLVTAVSCSTPESKKPSLTYPVTAKGDVVDNYAGTNVPDPYRGLEDLDAKATADWVASQN
ncbi:MAG: hypothetical protein IT178_18515, partial [Acidobacteria bacterium]|nr:hypothetical protein [Acidobacteriota bacterium]